MADYADFPEYSAEAAAIEKRRKIAEMLMAQGMTPLEVNQMAGGNVVPIHPLQGLGQLAKAWVAKSQMDEADAQKKDLGTRYEGMKQAEIDKALAAMSPTPEIPAPPAELGGGPGRAPMQKSPEEMRQAIIETSLSRSPEVRAFGALQQKFMEADEARKAALDQRKWEATQRAQDRIDQIRLAAAEGRITREEADKRAADLKKELAKMGGGHGAQPYSIPVQTAQGIFAFDTRNKTLSPMMADGKPVVGAQADPNLQGQIAGAKASGKELGEAGAKAQVQLPQVIATGERAIKQVDDILKHPGLESAVGMTLTPGMRFVEGSKEADFMSRLDQAKGGAFLEAYNTLKGGGQITEIEGKKATEAITRMSKAQSEAEFKAAARDYQDVIRAGIGIAKTRAKGAGPATASTKRLRFDENGNLVP